MTDLLNDIATQLRHFTHEEIVALLQSFLAGLDAPQQQRFHALVSQGPRPLVAEAMGLEDAEDLLGNIRELRDAIENGEYVEYGSGYDPEYGDYRGFGDDSWIEEMDNLFSATTSLFRAGQFKAAAEAYLELFRIFDLAEDGFLFTRPDPQEALRTDLDAIKQNLFIAVARTQREPAPEALEYSAELVYVAHNPYALLDAWQGREELMAALEAELIRLTRVEADQSSPYGEVLSHPAGLLRELYRRYRDTAACEALCRQIGRRQGWPYIDLVQRHQELGSWEQVLAWSDDGLAKLPARSRYRPVLQEARGQALLCLARPADAYDELLALFGRERRTPVYLKLREAAQATSRWGALYPQLVDEMQKYVLAKTRQEESCYAGDLMVAGLLGYARLLEGEWQAALEWALDPAVPAGWGDGDLVHTVATGLLRMGVGAQDHKRDDVVAQELDAAPRIIREYGGHLEAVAHTLPADAILDAAVRLYERLVERAVGGRDRDAYAKAGAYCRVIRSMRRLQKREADFTRYYQGLFESYRRYPALKDELRKAVEGSGYRRKP